jgi:hypothetical protein
MRKLILVLLATACFLSAYAQDVKKFAFSPKVGVNGSFLDVEYQKNEYQGRLGWHAGADLRFRGGWFMFHPGIHFMSTTTRLFQEGDNINEESIEEESTFQTLKTPISIGFFLTGSDGLVKIHVRGGAVPTFLLGVKQKPRFSFLEDDLNDFTIGLQGALGIDIAFFTIDLSYEHSLSRFFAERDGENRLLMASFGFVF